MSVSNGVVVVVHVVILCGLTNRRKLVSAGTNHRQLANLASSSEVEQTEAYNTDLLVTPTHTTADETCRILASTDHTHIERSHGCYTVGN